MHEQPEIAVDVWGCRGTRNVLLSQSQVGNFTSCYSVLSGNSLVVLDAGSGLARLAEAMTTQPRFAKVTDVHVLVTHAHMDHWEGLKDVEWFWRPNNGLSVTLCGCREVLDTIERGFAPPSFVPLELLAERTVARFQTVRLESDQRLSIGDFAVTTAALHHYSGENDNKRHVDTLGFVVDCGPCRVAYLSDHEPTEATQGLERAMLDGAQLAILDSHFSHVCDHAYGHGSKEYAAALARENPGILIVAAHHGPLATDEALHASVATYGQGLSNYELACEHIRYRWHAAEKRFQPHAAS